MRYVLAVVGAVLALMGAVWFLQGTGILQGSVMTGQSFWLLAGLVALVVGIGVLYLGLRGRRVAPSA